MSTLAERIKQGFQENYRYPRYGECLRCRRKWPMCTEHATPITSQESMFPLCEECWQELSIEQRIAYYYQLWSEWLVMCFDAGQTCHEWPAIEQAVRDGK